MASRGPMNVQSRSRGAARVFSFCSVCFLFRSTAQFWFGPLRADGVWQVRISGATHLCLLQGCGLGSCRLCRSRPAPTTCSQSLSSLFFFSSLPLFSFLPFLFLSHSLLCCLSLPPCLSTSPSLSGGLTSGRVRVKVCLDTPLACTSTSCRIWPHSPKSFPASFFLLKSRKGGRGMGLTSCLTLAITSRLESDVTSTRSSHLWASVSPEVLPSS